MLFQSGQNRMKIKIGFEIAFGALQPTPMVILLNVHPSRQGDLLTSDQITTSPLVPIRPYHDSFGNECGRLFLPAGRTVLSYSGIVRDTGQPDPVAPTAHQIAVQDLPDQCILYLLPSRYCETSQAPRLAALHGGASAQVRRNGLLLGPSNMGKEEWVRSQY